MNLPDVELSALELLTKANQHGESTDLVKIGEQFRHLTIQEADLDGEGYLLDAAPLGSIILVRRDSHPARKRYTIAHELGHLFLQDRGLEKAEIGPERIEIEKWCDAFASALLLPRSILDSFANSRYSWVEIIRTSPLQLGVSRQALCNRLATVYSLGIYFTDRLGTRIMQTHLPGVAKGHDLSEIVLKHVRFFHRKAISEIHYDKDYGFWVNIGPLTTTRTEQYIAVLEGLEGLNGFHRP